MEWYRIWLFEKYKYELKDGNGFVKEINEYNKFLFEGE